MQITDDGVLVVTGAEDLDRLTALADRLAGALYGRLPRLARLFVSREGFRALIDLAFTAVTQLGG